MAGKSGISFRSGLHQLNEVGLNTSTVIKSFEMEKEKEISSKTPGLTAPSVERGGRASRQEYKHGGGEQPATDRTGQK